MRKYEKSVPGMKVRYIRDSYKTSLITGKVYDVIALYDDGHDVEYRIVDESGEDYLYSEKAFEVVQGSADPPVAHSAGQVPPAG